MVLRRVDFTEKGPAHETTISRNLCSLQHCCVKNSLPSTCEADSLCFAHSRFTTQGLHIRTQRLLVQVCNVRSTCIYIRNSLPVTLTEISLLWTQCGFPPFIPTPCWMSLGTYHPGLPFLGSLRGFPRKSLGTYHPGSRRTFCPFLVSCGFPPLVVEYLSTLTVQLGNVTLTPFAHSSFPDVSPHYIFPLPAECLMRLAIQVDDGTFTTFCPF